MKVPRKGSDKSKEIAYKSLVRPVMEYGAACWDPYRLEHIKTLEKIKKRALKCCRKNSPLKWDTLTDRRTRIRLCALFKTYRGEPAWRDIKNRLQPPNYSSRNDHSYKLRERRQRTDTGKFSFLNRTIRNWNALPADLLKALPTTKNAFKNRLKDLTNRRTIKSTTLPCEAILALRIQLQLLKGHTRENLVFNPPKRNTILGLVNKLKQLDLCYEKGKHRSSLPTVVATSLLPPRSPDLTTPDFFLWGYLKDRFYATCPQTLDDLKSKSHRRFKLTTESSNEWPVTWNDVLNCALCRMEDIFNICYRECNDAERYHVVPLMPVSPVTMFIQMGYNEPTCEMFTTQFNAKSGQMIQLSD
ncbi:hypothetical protein ANN_26502 [Periplaneta americana]|uniref:Uncharacterized protein n=1 Tax=Periplaneta americana TaxID=6978 RepID=A0ABQ8RYB6_PERAM|nr:hypothetical protein ANN_26502 [Periplaneta americana]